jgi:hypothetical protein
MTTSDEKHKIEEQKIISRIAADHGRVEKKTVDEVVVKAKRDEEDKSAEELNSDAIQRSKDNAAQLAILHAALAKRGVQLHEEPAIPGEIEKRADLHQIVDSFFTRDLEGFRGSATVEQVSKALHALVDRL